MKLKSQSLHKVLWLWSRCSIGWVAQSLRLATGCFESHFCHSYMTSLWVCYGKVILFKEEPEVGHEVGAWRILALRDRPVIGCMGSVPCHSWESMSVFFQIIYILHLLWSSGECTVCCLHVKWHNKQLQKWRAFEYLFTSPQENHTELYLSSQIPYIYPDSQPEPGSASMGMRSGKQTFLSGASHGSSLLSVGHSGSLVIVASTLAIAKLITWLEMRGFF